MTLTTAVLALGLGGPAAHAMKNLAYHYPARELASDDVLFIERDDPVFAEYNTTVPPGRFLMVERAKIWAREGASTAFRLQREKPRIARILREEVAAIDEQVSTELHAAGVRVEQLARRPEAAEVPTRFVGWFGHYRFTRGWSYWIVDGTTPYDLAMTIYDDPVGRRAIRTDGHAGNVSPAVWKHAIEGYHVDTAEGLARFVALVRAHGIQCEGPLGPTPH